MAEEVRWGWDWRGWAAKVIWGKKAFSKASTSNTMIPKEFTPEVQYYLKARGGK